MSFSYKYVNFEHYTGQKSHFLSTRSVLWPKNMSKCISGQWGNNSRRSPDPLVGWGGDTPPMPYHTQRFRRLDRSILVPPAEAWSNDLDFDP